MLDPKGLFSIEDGVDLDAGDSTPDPGVADGGARRALRLPTTSDLLGVLRRGGEDAPEAVEGAEPVADSDEKRPDEDLVLVHALHGFIDAGSATRLASDHVLSTLDHVRVATFDVDQLVDYRSRRPAMIYDRDHYASFASPELVVDRVHDRSGKPFLLMTGPEPDLQWERFAQAVRLLVEQFGVTRTIGLSAIPMAVPHTRPLGVLGHGTSGGLRHLRVTDPAPAHPLPTVQVPGSAAALLEYRLGEWGFDALGFVVQVPHYLSDTPYPEAAALLLGRLGRTAGLDLPIAALESAAVQTRAAIAEQVAGSEEVARVVHALEQQYDAFVGSQGRTALLAGTEVELPSADELGAEVERFLAAHTEEEPPSDGA